MSNNMHSDESVNYRALENTLRHLNSDLQLPRSSNGHDLIYLIEIIGQSIAISGFCPLADGEFYHQPRHALHSGQLWVGRKSHVFTDFDPNTELDGDRLVWIYNRMRACRYEEFFLESGQAQFNMLLTGDLAYELMTRPVNENKADKEQHSKPCQTPASTAKTISHTRATHKQGA